MPDLKEMVENPGLQLAATTLGQLLDELERTTGEYVIADDPPKYFRYYQSRESQDFTLVDIHVERAGIEICPKQDLMFALLPDDIVEAGILIC